MRTKTPVGHRRRVVSPPPPSFFTIPILSTTQDEYNGTTFETSCESDDKQQFHVADCIHQDESIDLLDKNICICCNQGGGVLVYSQTACPVTLHVNCLDSESKFDDFGNFYCPYCWYKRAVDKCQELREKTMTTKKALSSFLDKNGGSMMKEVVVGDGDNRHDATNGVHSQNLQERKKYVADQDSMNLEKFNKPDTSETRDARNKDRKEIKDLGHNMEDGCERIVEVGEEVPVEPLSGSSLGMCGSVQSQNVACDKGAEETVANLAEDKGKIKDQGKLPRVEQKMSSTSSSMSEANDSDFEVVSLKKGRVKRKLPETAYPQKVAPVNKSLFKEHSTAEKNASNISEEVTSSRTLRQPHTSPNYVCSRNLSFLAGRRKPLRWTVEEETTLKEGVLKFSTKNEKVPWKRILEFGSRVFDKTRTPIDLKDKWRNITAKEGL